MTDDPQFHLVGVKLSPEQYKLLNAQDRDRLLFSQTDKDGNVYWGHEVENTLDDFLSLDDLVEIDSMDFPHVPAYIEAFLRPFGALHYWVAKK